MTPFELTLVAVVALLVAPRLTVLALRAKARRDAKAEREAYWRRVPRRTETFAEARERRARRA